MGKQITFTCEIKNPEEYEKWIQGLMQATNLINEWAENKLILGSDKLVKVATGDGIGFNDSQTVKTTTKYGCSVLIKKNYSKPFEMAKCLMHNTPCTSMKDLKFGGTYVIVPIDVDYPWENILGVFKYLGHNCVMMADYPEIIHTMSPKIFKEFYVYQLSVIN